MAAKWYVDQTHVFHSTFVTLANDFISYFQLPLRYDMGNELLTSFRQYFATRISNHVQECCKRSICKTPEFEYHVYMHWFFRTLFAP